MRNYSINAKFTRSYLKIFNQVQDQGISRRTTTVIQPLNGFRGMATSIQRSLFSRVIPP